MSKHNQRIRVFFGNERPSGLGHAFRKAFSKVSKSSDFVITMDADLNHQPEEISRFIKSQKETNADIVVGSRHVKGSIKKGVPLFKKIVSNLTNYFFSYCFGVKVKDKTSGYRLYKTNMLKKINYSSNDFEFLPEMLIIAQKKGMSIKEIPITFKFRIKGISKLRWGKAFKGYALLVLKRIFRK